MAHLKGGPQFNSHLFIHLAPVGDHSATGEKKAIRREAIRFLPIGRFAHVSCMILGIKEIEFPGKDVLKIIQVSQRTCRQRVYHGLHDGYIITFFAPIEPVYQRPACFFAQAPFGGLTIQFDTDGSIGIFLLQIQDGVRTDVAERKRRVLVVAQAIEFVKIRLSGG